VNHRLLDIKARHANGYITMRDDGDALDAAMFDVAALLAELTRQRAQDRDAVVAWLLMLARGADFAVSAALTDAANDIRLERHRNGDEP